MIAPEIKCQGVSKPCSNSARYVTASGRWLCSLCDMQSAWPSVRVSDMPLLLSLVDRSFRGGLIEADMNLLKGLLWRKNPV